MEEDECSLLKEELRLLTLECDHLKLVKCNFDNEVATCSNNDSESLGSIALNETAQFTKRCVQRKLQLAQTLNDLKEALSQCDNDVKELKYLSDSVEQFCSVDELNLTKFLTEILNSATEGMAAGATTAEQNQTDLERLSATFAALGKKELELKLENCLRNGQMDFCCKFTECDVPSSDSLQKSVENLTSRLNKLDADNKKLLEELKLSVLALLPKTKLLSVYATDYENGDRFFQFLDEHHRKCFAEIKKQCSRLPDFVTLVDNLLKEQSNNAKAVNAIERVLKERLKTVKRLRKLVETAKIKENSDFEILLLHNAENRPEVDDSEIVFSSTSGQFFRNLFNEHRTIINDCGVRLQEKTLTADEAIQELTTKLKDLEDRLTIYVQVSK